MSEIALEVLFILILILANGLLAMSEIAIVSVRKIRLQQRAEDGDEKARVALDLSNNPADFLSTVQIGITLVGILVGAFSGATIAEEISKRLGRIPVLAPYNEALAIGLVVVVITYLSLIFGELAPKRVALSDPERTAIKVATLMRWLSRIASPFAHFLSASTSLVLRIVGIKSNTESTLTEEEIKILIEQATENGVFEEVEQEMVASVFRLGDRSVSTLMTPRTEIVWLDLEDLPKETRRKIIESSHTRFPVSKSTLDDVQGIVQAKELLVQSLEGLPLNLQDSMEAPVFVPESMPALEVLERIREARLQMVLVIDEFGGLQGLVTLNDILEAIVGDIPLLGQPIELEAIQREDGSWLLDGMLPIDEFKEIFDIDELPNETRGSYRTVGGFVLTYLGRIPVSGDHFKWEGMKIEVVDMDGLRIDKVLVAPSEPGSPPNKDV